MSGWIKLSRKIQNNPLWDDGEPFDRRSAWIDLLLLANHSEHDIFYHGKVVTVRRGEVNRSILQLAERWRWSRGKVSRYLKFLENAKMCTTNSTTDGTTIYIENYTKYQNLRATNDTTDRATDGQPTDNGRTAHGQRTDTYKNDKECIIMIKNDKKGNIPPPEIIEQRINDFKKKKDEINARFK